MMLPGVKLHWLRLFGAVYFFLHTWGLHHVKAKTIYYTEGIYLQSVYQ